MGGGGGFGPRTSGGVREAGQTGGPSDAPAGHERPAVMDTDAETAIDTISENFHGQDGVATSVALIPRGGESFSRG